MGTIHEHHEGYNTKTGRASTNPWTGNGWTELIYACHDELVALDPTYQILQIKEKFGGLRYYFDPTDQDNWDALNDVVKKYEAIAIKTCEACGQPGEPSNKNSYWIKTTCSDCDKVRPR